MISSSPYGFTDDDSNASAGAIDEAMDVTSRVSALRRHSPGRVVKEALFVRRPLLPPSFQLFR
ncbi:unnamed protein product [Toxocara canis]|uniref:Uncharacterized protein n=1 Tax=Toxocara canis TaxID=6265 RepID=A0A183UR16_TOXCA|nr:unnamed protein product [Toxocara canis]